MPPNASKYPDNCVVCSVIAEGADIFVNYSARWTRQVVISMVYPTAWWYVGLGEGGTAMGIDASLMAGV